MWFQAAKVQNYQQVTITLGKSFFGNVNIRRRKVCLATLN